MIIRHLNFEKSEKCIFEKSLKRCILESVKFGNPMWDMLRKSKQHTYMKVFSILKHPLIFCSVSPVIAYIVFPFMRWDYLIHFELQLTFSLRKYIRSLFHTSLPHFLKMLFRNLKLLFRNSFSIFKLEITNCSAQSSFKQ